jgi:hypothetical protein
MEFSLHPPLGSSADEISNTPAGNIAATNVQSAINELDSEKAALAGDAAQAFSCSTLTAATGVLGVADGSDAGAGYIGEVISSSVAVGSPVALTTATTADVTSITLTSGRWLITGNVNFTQVGGVTSTSQLGGISGTSGISPALDKTSVFSVGTGIASLVTRQTVPPQYASPGTTTTYYLVAQATFTGGTSLSAYGNIQAVRVG